MQLFKNILLVAGGEGWEETAFKRAVTLAENYKAKLSVVDVVEKIPPEVQMLIQSMHLADIQQTLIKERLVELENLIAPIRDKGVYVTVKAPGGSPFLEIIREVLRSKCDLVMKIAGGKGGVNEILFGSTDTHLMRKCPCPVWIIKPAQRKKYARVTAAVDPDPYDKKRNALNARIMELATSVARMEDSELHIIHAWNLDIEKTLLWRAGVSKSEVDKLVRKVRKEHEGLIAELADKYAPDHPKDRIHLLKGSAEKLIPALAKMKKIELLVMGTVSRTGISGFFIGNTAEKVLQQVDCSVLTVKPEGFVTPVKLR